METHVRQTLRGALERCRSHLVGVGIFSGLLNLLFIVPMLYMLQVYDRVVPTRGAGTLLILTVVLLLGLGTLALLDWVRSRLLVRASLRLEQELAGALLNAALARPDRPMEAVTRQPMREFDTLRQTLTGPTLLAICDAPWAPIYIIVCTIIHPLIGLLVLVGGAVMAAVTWLSTNTNMYASTASARAMPQWTHASANAAA